MKKTKQHSHSVQNANIQEGMTTILLSSILLFTVGAGVYGYRAFPPVDEVGSREFHAFAVGMAAFFSTGIGATIGHHLFKTTSKIAVFPFIRDKAKRTGIHARNGMRGAFLGAAFLGYQAMPIAYDYLKSDYLDYYGVQQTTNNIKSSALKIN